MWPPWPPWPPVAPYPRLGLTRPTSRLVYADPVGLFSRLFGRSREPQCDESADAAKASQTISADTWDAMDTAARARWFGTQLEAVEATCDKAGIRVRAELGKAELRGMRGGRPIAVSVDDSGALELTVKLINRRGHLNLGPPLPGISDREDDDGEFWADDDDERAPLLGPGVALYARTKTLAERRAVWTGLPDDDRQRVLAWIGGGSGGGIGHHHVAARHQALESHQPVGPAFGVPVTPTILRGLDELLALAERFVEGDAPLEPIGAGPAWSPERQTCSYCSSVFYVDRGDPRCPACGASG